LHDLRIAWKELRYACELLAEALPPDVTALAEPAAKMQKRLGEIHDADAALAAVARARSMEPLLRVRLQQALHLRRDRLVDKYVELANAHAEQARAAEEARAAAETHSNGAPANGATLSS
jgi:CHAD domain-containing protein